MKKQIALAALVLTCVLAMALAGCAGKGTMSSDIDDAGTYTVTADDAGKGSAVFTDGGIIVKEGQVLAISSALEKGSLQLRLLSSGSSSAEPVIDEDVSGEVVDTRELEPGEYGIGVTCNADGTTGTLVVAAVDKEEFEKQSSGQ